MTNCPGKDPWCAVGFQKEKLSDVEPAPEKLNKIVHLLSLLIPAVFSRYSRATFLCAFFTRTGPAMKNHTKEVKRINK